MKMIKDSFAGVIIGIILFVVGIGLLWWNEGNNVKNIKTVDELRKNYVDVSISPIDSANEGKLVALTGKMTIEDSALVDEVFNVEIKSAKLKRVVEMYQWTETQSEEEGKTTYSYEKKWSEGRIDSSEFNESAKHSNPSIEFESTEYKANNIKLGDFSLSSKQINQLPASDALRLDSEKTYKEGYTVNGLYLTNAKSMDNPEIGDIRIKFLYANYEDISILAVQKGNSFVDYISKVGKHTNKVLTGTYDGKGIITNIEEGNNFLKWLLRIVGAIAIFLGILSILGPISTIASFVPILGGIVGFTLFLISLLLSLAISLIVIAIAWVFYRPLLGILLLVISIGLIIGVKAIIKKNKEKKAEA